MIEESEDAYLARLKERSQAAFYDRKLIHEELKELHLATGVIQREVANLRAKVSQVDTNQHWNTLFQTSSWTIRGHLWCRG